MDQEKFFKSIIEPSTERLGLYGISHDVRFDERDFVVTHKISKNVFTAFDGKLSRYLAATTGTGLPNATVETRIRDVAGGRSWTPYAAKHAASIPDALAAAARMALGERPNVSTRIGAWLNDGPGTDQLTTITVDTIQVLERALKVCSQIGTVEFLDVSGDFERVLARPVDSAMEMMVVDLERGTVAIPTVAATGGPAWSGPIYGFDKAITKAPAVSAFLGRARHAVSKAKEDAILNFREAAEERIMCFNSALAGRELTGFRLKSAASLVSRLQAGLGDTLLGLNEAAQITALDWAGQVRETTAAPKAPAARVIERQGDVPKPRPRLVR